eukprot:4602307-Karenia_brevis.AAC.1
MMMMMVVVPLVMMMSLGGRLGVRLQGVSVEVSTGCGIGGAWVPQPDRTPLPELESTPPDAR